MGNTQPQNKTGRKVVTQKLENAKKTGVLSLSEHKLDECPPQVFGLVNLKTLDLSKNQLKKLPPSISNLVNLKSLNLEQNQLPAGSLVPLESLTKLQNLSVGGNSLGRMVPSKTATALPEQLPPQLKQVKLHANYLSSVPPSILSPHLTRLEKLDLSQNQLAWIPEEITNLQNLTELNLDDNVIVSLPVIMGTLRKLKVLSLKSNRITVESTNWSETTNPQPLPQSLFADTPLIDLNLHGNKMTSTQLNSMQGYDQFLERRQKVKTATLLGGGLTNLDVCGLE